MVWRAVATTILVMAASSLGCGSDTDEGGAVGDPCGAGTCAETQYCCHPECALCVEQGVACPADCS